MESRLYAIESYIGPNDAFHFARKDIGPVPPTHAHFHDYFEVFLVEKGTLRHWVNATLQTLDEGSLVFMRPADSHALYAATPQGCRIINILFPAQIARHLVERYADDLEGSFFWSPGQIPATYHLTGPRRERAVNVALELQTSIRSLLRIEEFLLTIMGRVLGVEQHGREAPPGWLIEACAQAREPQVFRGGPSAFVEAAGRGHEHVCRQTKLHFGLTPSALINRYRMEYAASLLAGAGKSISEIAEDCGIENLSHFYRTFRRHYGVTPKSYRQQHLKSPI